METARTEEAEMTREPRFPKRQRENAEKMIQDFCGDPRTESLQEANKKSQQRKPGGPPQKCRQL